MHSSKERKYANVPFWRLSCCLCLLHVPLSSDELTLESMKYSKLSVILIVSLQNHQLSYLLFLPLNFSIFFIYLFSLPFSFSHPSLCLTILIIIIVSQSIILPFHFLFLLSLSSVFQPLSVVLVYQHLSAIYWHITVSIPCLFDECVLSP